MVWRGVHPSQIKTVLTQDHFYSTFISTWFSKVDILNKLDDRIGFLPLTRDVGTKWRGSSALPPVR